LGNQPSSDVRRETYFESVKQDETGELTENIGSEEKSQGLFGHKGWAKIVKGIVLGFFTFFWS